MTDYERLLSGIRLGDLEVVRSCIQTSPSVVHAVDQRLGLSTVFHAVLVQQLEVLRLLLSLGSSPNTPNSLGDTPLHQAADDSALAVAAELIQFGADVNAQNRSGESALHNAVYRGDLALTELLLTNGADPNLQSRHSGQTPLHLAIAEHSESIVKALLSCQAAVDLADVAGYTARSLAKTTGLETLLEQSGKNLESKQTEVTHQSIVVHLEASGEQEADGLELLTPEQAQLLELLQELELDNCFEVLLRLGYSSVPLLLEFVQSDTSPGLRLLADCGVDQLGARFAMLVKLEQATGRIPSVSIKYSQPHGASLRVCGYSLVSPAYVTTVTQWLEELRLPQYTPNFAEAGFSSLELLYLQMHSSRPMTCDLLELTGVFDSSHQASILSKLVEDTQLFIELREDPTAPCSCLLL